MRFRIFTSLFYLGLTLGFFLPPLSRGDDPPRATTYEIQGEIGSAYRFRGIERYHGMFLSLGGQADVPFGKHSSFVWGLNGIAPLQGNRDDKVFYETRPSLQYVVSAGPGRVTVGGEGFFYSGNGQPPSGDTGDAFFKLELDALGSPSLKIYQESIKNHSRYLELGLKYDYQPDYYDRRFVVSPFVVSGYSYNQYESECAGSGLNHFDLGIKTTWKFDVVELVPQAVYTQSKDTLIRSGGRVELLVKKSF